MALRGAWSDLQHKEKWLGLFINHVETSGAIISVSRVTTHGTLFSHAFRSFTVISGRPTYKLNTYRP